MPAIPATRTAAVRELFGLRWIFAVLVLRFRLRLGPYSPIFLPTWQLYGPGPIMQMMGVVGWFNGVPNGGGSNGGNGGNGAFAAAAPRAGNQAIAANGPANGLGNGGGQSGRQRTTGRPKTPPKPATDMAVRYIGFGDTYFGQQKYADALDRYQKAAKADPGVADAWFRQGVRPLGVGRYGEAVKAVAQGLKISPIWPTSDFLLTDVYGVNEAGRKATLNTLAKAVEHSPADADATLLLGIHYYFDGQREAAKTTFENAAKLRNDGLADAFLK